MIVLDQYSSFDKSLDGGVALEWIENALHTPDHIRHVFVAFHEPYLPYQAENDPFWSLLLRHQDKVRAVFAAHIHIYHMESFPINCNRNLLCQCGECRTEQPQRQEADHR